MEITINSSSRYYDTHSVTIDLPDDLAPLAPVLRDLGARIHGHETAEQASAADVSDGRVAICVAL